MEIIGAVFILILIVAGLVFAKHGDDEEPEDNEPDDLPRVVIMQEVPDPLAAFQRKKK